jgi:hypothetical protein
MRESLDLVRTRGLDVLHLRFNKFDGNVVLVATTREFINEDMKLQLLCGENGRFWLHDYASDFKYVAGFLSLYQAAGMW